ncbi:MAG: hypothetical protein WCZ68_08730, partial [Sedimentibacter sp.]
DDFINGHGVTIYVNGDKYEGEFVNGMKEGLGTYTFENGNKYVGKFKDGKKEGSGVLYYIDGTIEEGKWENDNYVGNNEQNNEIIQVIETVD